MKYRIITNVTPVLKDFADFFSIIYYIIISFQHVLYFDVGKSQIQRNMKVKSEI